MEHSIQLALAQRFHALHHATDLLVLPNAWDTGSALVFERAGFPAVGTTSAGFAFTLGRADGQISRDQMLSIVAPMAARLSVPLSVDIEAGFGETVEEVVATVRAVVGLGAVGFNLEDAAPETAARLRPLDEAVARIRALAALRQDMDVPFFINARTDVYWLQVGAPDERARLGAERCAAFAAAGADGVFVPSVVEAEALHLIANAARRPLNVLASPRLPPLAELRTMGVARLSLGSGIVRAALGLTQTIAQELRDGASLASLSTHALPYDEANRLFTDR